VWQFWTVLHQIPLDSCRVTASTWASSNNDPHAIKHLVRSNWVRSPIGGGRAHHRPVPVNAGGHFRNCFQETSNLARRVHQWQLEPALRDQNYLDIGRRLVSFIVDNRSADELHRLPVSSIEWRRRTYSPDYGEGHYVGSCIFVF
jgi:hypothetical protein